MSVHLSASICKLSNIDKGPYGWKKVRFSLGIGISTAGGPGRGSPGHPDSWHKGLTERRPQAHRELQPIMEPIPNTLRSAAPGVRVKRSWPRLAPAAHVLTTLALCLAPTCAWGATAPQAFDVVVYGATPSGIMAAIGAHDQGMSVALVDPGKHVGGMVAGGLSYTDIERQEYLVGGATLDFFKALGAHYGDAIGWRFEPHIAEEQFNRLLESHGITVMHGEQVDGTRKQQSKLLSLHTAAGHTVTAKIFIDSSYEGDLMKFAGVSYTVGREGTAQYGESLGGRQDLLPGQHNFRTDVYGEGLISNLPGTAVAPHITPQEQVVPTGQADGRFQSYCYRITVTDDDANRIEFSAPQGYRPEQYELLKRYLASNPTIGIKGVLGINRIPHAKGDTNSNGPVSLDYLGGNLGYPDGTPQQREQIARAHLAWAQGLFYFLQHDPSVPASLQADVRRWGLPKDEFTDTDHLPFQMYVREGRRMLGSYILTQKDLQTARTKVDSVGVAGYNIDIREVQWLTHRVYHFPEVHDQVFTEGYLSQPVEPWEIPLRALLPKPEQVSNLLVTSCISASTIAYASYRLEPTYMVAGESAGIAAALAIQTGRSLHTLDVVRLQTLLRSRHQILSANESISRRGEL